MARIDFHDDPAAPPATSLVPCANVVVTNDAGQVLVIHRTDNDHWTVPGGGMDIGESLPDCARRETLEETGIECEITGLVGVYTDPGHVILYTGDGPGGRGVATACQEFSVVFTARAVGGEPTTSTESRAVRWVEPDELALLDMDASMRLRLGHWLEGRTEPYLG